jgi:diguanylate cyclase (GGDEF)-like protein/PAS domain S-box-containing protein
MSEEALLRAEIVRLNKVIQALMNRAERSTELQGSEFSLFQTAIMLDDQVRGRTAELEMALHENEMVYRALRESEARYHALVDQSLIGIAIVEEDKFSYANPRFAEIFEYDPVEISALGPLDVTVEEDHPLVIEQLRVWKAGEVERTHYQIRGRRKGGEQLDIEVYGNTVALGSKRVLVNLIQDVTERCRAEREVRLLQEKLREQLLRDPLTGLYNRRYQQEALDRELHLAKRHQQPVSLIMGDLDHFKDVNDRYGHQAGDRVLRFFSDLLGRFARASDINCRFGGEEFLLIMPGMRKADAALRAECLRSAVAATPVEFLGAGITVTASFGVATYPVDGCSADSLVAAADAALYTAKRGGRNQVATAGEGVLE